MQEQNQKSERKSKRTLQTTSTKKTGSRCVDSKLSKCVKCHFINFHNNSKITVLAHETMRLFIKFKKSINRGIKMI